MNDNRRKLTGILKLLYENTDAEHSMNTYQIMDALEGIGHARPDRKTIDANIKFIIEDLGFGIIKEKGKPNRYRWIDREFSIDELEMLADAVHSSRFISKKKGREIIAKLKDLTSVHQAALLNREVYTCRGYNRDGSQALSNASIVTECIKNFHRITFQMADYDVYKNEILAFDGKVYEVSPYAIMCNRGFCYMVGKPSDSPDVKEFRLDRMRNASQSRMPSEHEPKDFSTEKYSEHVFDMFTGNVMEVELSCRNSAMGAVIDRFGRDFYTEKTGPDTFSARVNVETSPAFYSWVFRQGGSVSIAAPVSVKAEYSKMLMDQLK
jgi:predicted DNA-binding transcriptional regulator YafY